MGENKRSYGQHCTVARALDVVGERWTLLLVRELSTGPKRFKDLLGGLPGIGTNLLAGRLKALEGEGIVRRSTLPPPSVRGWQSPTRGRPDCALTASDESRSFVWGPSVHTAR